MSLRITMEPIDNKKPFINLGRNVEVFDMDSGTKIEGIRNIEISAPQDGWVTANLEIPVGVLDLDGVDFPSLDKEEYIRFVDNNGHTMKLVPRTATENVGRRTGKSVGLLLQSISRAILAQGKEIEFIDHFPHTPDTAQHWKSILDDFIELLELRMGVRCVGTQVYIRSLFV